VTAQPIGPEPAPTDPVQPAVLWASTLTPAPVVSKYYVVQNLAKGFAFEIPRPADHFQHVRSTSEILSISAYDLNGKNPTTDN
jgi:hypothetical protein